MGDSIGSIAAANQVVRGESFEGGPRFEGTRGALIAACASIPSRIQLITLSSVAEIIVGPPGEPVTKLSLPSRSKIVGVIELSGRCPGAIAFASD